MGVVKHFYDAKDVQQLLGCGTIRTAQMRIKAMNDELKEKGYWTERGKVPVTFFHEKYPFIPRPEEINVAKARRLPNEQTTNFQPLDVR